MSTPNAPELYAKVVRRALFLTVLHVLFATTLAVSGLFLLGGVVALLSGGPTLGAIVPLLLTTLIGWLIFQIFLKTVGGIRALFRFPNYPRRHWEVVADHLRWVITVESVGLVVAISLTGWAIRANGPGADPLLTAASVADAVFLLVLLGCVGGTDDAMRFASVVPYFRQRVGEIDTFGRGESLARHVAEFDDLARSMGLTPLSEFGWNDDMAGEPLIWHEPGGGLKTVNGLLAHVQGEDLAFEEQAALLDDLKRLAHALSRAEEQEIPFCLLLRHTRVTNGLEWEARKGTCF